jgi:hypothetical protein
VQLRTLLVHSAIVGACASSHTKLAYTALPQPPHDVTLDLAAPPVLYGVSDVHGGYDRLAALLAGGGVLPKIPDAPEHAAWGAGSALLVVVGDLIDKGPQPLEVIDFLRALETSAQAAGGRVVVLLGNHEAEFFVDPGNSKADGSDGVDAELRARAIDPTSLASGADPRGAWLRARPIAAKVGAWFFAHAGDTHGRSLADLDTALRAAVDVHPDYDDPELVGGASILESRGWYGDPSVAPTYAAALGVTHIVFGHDPNALGPRGLIAVAQGGVLFRIDCGLSPDVNDSTGMLLRVTQSGDEDVAEALDASGKATALWRGPR